MITFCEILDLVDKRQSAEVVSEVTTVTQKAREAIERRKIWIASREGQIDAIEETLNELSALFDDNEFKNKAQLHEYLNKNHRKVLGYLQEDDHKATYNR